LVLVISALGAAMIFSASYPKEGMDNITKTLGFTLAGYVIVFVLYNIDYTHIRKFCWIVMLATMIILVLMAFTGIGEEKGGAGRWLRIGPISFQPSEICKLAIIMFLSSFFASNDELLRYNGYANTRFSTWLFRASNRTFAVVAPGTRRGIRYKKGLPAALYAFLVCTVAAALVLKQSHLSGTIIILLISYVMFLISGIQKKYVMAVTVVGGAGAVGAMAYILWVYRKAQAVAGVVGLKGYQMGRIQNWLDKESELPGTDRWQINHSLYAIAEGGLFGRGYSNSVQKYANLSQADTDFVFAVVCEELGVVFGVIVLLLMFMLVFRGIYIALHAKNLFGTYLVGGIMAHIAIQTILHVLVVTDMIPTTGTTLPFFSYGGSSLLILYVEMGLVMSVSRQADCSKSFLYSALRRRSA
ncbi:MAG: FtsW/RodA/SpoVE family cell cycle protein, partial [Clostridia bacterium]|nr:FtsW/RodA/SpoVE family cell cycle protein [Clostridia bacterium]